MTATLIDIAETGRGRIPRGRKVRSCVEGEVEWYEMECLACSWTPLMFYSIDAGGIFRPYCQWCDPQNSAVRRRERECDCTSE